MDNKKIVLILFCVLIPVFLSLLSYKMILFFTVLTPEQENVFGFLAGNEKLIKGFTSNEVSHLEDVVVVTKIANYVFYALLLTIAGIIIYHRKDKHFVKKLFKYSGVTAVAVLCLKLLSSLLFFNFIFSIFHQLFFPQGNWTFPADSLLIRTFPLEFFIVVSRNIFLTSLFFGIIFILLGYILNHVLRNRN